MKGYRKNKKWGTIACFVCVIIILALFLEAGILNNVNNRNTNKTLQVLLNQVISIIERNQQSEEEMIQSMKEDYIVRAKAVSYIIDAKPQAEKDLKELKKIAKLMSVDEVHLFDTRGQIYSGSVSKYYGYSFNSGEQMSYFKPMLTNKKLTMCQDVTPNTSEGKKMMYAITWNEAGTRMVQVGIEPVRLLQEVKQNEVETVIGNMPIYEGIDIYVADKDSGKIYGATNEKKIGKTLDKIGISKKKVDKNKVSTDTIDIKGDKYNCIFKETGNYVVGVTFKTSSNNEKDFVTLLMVGAYMVLAAVCILFMVARVLKRKEQVEILSYKSNTDELTKCFNRRAYEEDMKKLSLQAEFVYISIDVNGLKIVNDTLGHAAGDELLQGASSCMKQCFDRYGKVYRIGGDEFVVVLFADRERFEAAKKDFDKKVKEWSGQKVKAMTVSYGVVFAKEQACNTVREIANMADIRMYEQKEIYYKENGLDRRKRT